MGNKPLPLPRSWLNRIEPDSTVEKRLESRETALTGRGQTPGSKAHFRRTLLDAGWDVEDVEAVAAGKFIAREQITNLSAGQDPDINAALQRFKAAGFSPTPVATGMGSLALSEQWDSLTRFPWWLSALRGHRSVLLAAKTQGLVRKASAGLVRDLWVNLGEPPEHRMPIVRRVNLLSFTSSDALSRFESTIGKETDVVVLSGLDTEDFIYQMLGYASAMSSAAPHALIVYEAVPGQMSEDVLVSAAKRSGFHYLWRVSRHA